MPYITETDIHPLLPPDFLREALDDDRDGAADAGLLDGVIAAAEREVNAALESRFTVPFSDPPELVVQATLVLALSALYMRRGVPQEHNPWAQQATDMRKRLTAIGSGEAPLKPSVKPTKPPVSIITQPSGTHSSSGRMIT